MSSLDRTQAPPFQLSRNYTLVRPDIIPVAKGVDFFLFRNIQQDVVKLELIFSSGKWYEPKLGVSHFTAQMLSKGTANRNSFQIAEAIDLLGAHLEITPGFDVVSVSLLCLRKNMLAAIRILVEILEEPAFDEQELSLMKDIFIQNLKVNNEKTAVVASREIRKAVFGAHHPYGSAVEEQDAGLITTEDLREALLAVPTTQRTDVLGRPLGEDLNLPELLAEVARHYLERALDEAGGNKTKAAGLVGLPSYQTLTNWLQRYEVKR